jgi:alkylation response protein AidB-like acyl-CoA dehydrogenase
VRFAFSPDSLAFRDAARALLKRECTPAMLRAAWQSDDGRVPGLWTKLTELGVPAVLAPEADGGLGMSELELVLLVEECGRAAVPEPMSETAAVAVPLLRDTRSPWLRRVVRGEARVAVGLGGAPFVLAASTADVLLLQHGDHLHVLEQRAVHLAAQPSIDSARRLFRVEWTPSPSTLLAEGAAAREAIDAARDGGAVATAAELLGAGRQLVETAVAYAKTRHQFGKPIGSFQAVKHHLADAHIALEMAAPAVYRAAYSLARRDPERSLHASMAKALASEAALLAARKALQCHGAIGYAFENDLHLWMKRVWALALAWGDASEHRARVSRSLFSMGGA